MNSAEEKIVASGNVRLWTQRLGSPGDPAVLLIMGTSAQGIGWPSGDRPPGMGHGFFSPGLPRHLGQLILGQTRSPAPGT